MKLEPLAILGDLSEGQRLQLRAYEGLVLSQAAPLGLVSPADVGRLWDRHIVDSLRALPCLGPDPKEAYDLGSGAGLPGVPVAVARPSMRVTLVEPRLRRAAFLEKVVEELRLANVDVTRSRAESLVARVDVCLVRALAPPADTWLMAGPLLRERGLVVYFAGVTWGDASRRAVAAVGGEATPCVEPMSPGGGPVVIMRASAPG